MPEELERRLATGELEPRWPAVVALAASALLSLLASSLLYFTPLP